MNTSALILSLALAAGMLAFALTLTWAEAHVKRECATWMLKTGEITRIDHNHCYVLERDQFVPIEQRRLDAEIQRQSQ